MKMKLDFEEFLYPNGDKYVGGWKDDKRHGRGTEIFINLGGKDLGQWKNGKRHGHFTTILTDGDKWKEIYKNGKKIKK